MFCGPKPMILCNARKAIDETYPMNHTDVQTVHLPEFFNIFQVNANETSGGFNLISIHFQNIFNKW